MRRKLSVLLLVAAALGFSADAGAAANPDGRPSIRGGVVSESGELGTWGIANGTIDLDGVGPFVEVIFPATPDFSFYGRWSRIVLDSEGRLSEPDDGPWISGSRYRANRFEFSVKLYLP